MTKILVVDDEPHTAQCLKQLLEQNGFVADVPKPGKNRVWSSGLDALRHLREAQPSYDVLCTDAMMPEMDGFELLHHLRTDAVTAHLPVIILAHPPAEAGEFEEAVQDRYRFGDDITVYVFKWGRKWPDAVLSAVQDILLRRCPRSTD